MSEHLFPPPPPTAAPRVYRNTLPDGPLDDEGETVWLPGHEPSLREVRRLLRQDWPEFADEHSLGVSLIWARLTFCPDPIYSGRAFEVYLWTDENADRHLPDHPHAGTLLDTECRSEWCGSWYEAPRSAPWALPFTRCEPTA